MSKKALLTAFSGSLFPQVNVSPTATAFSNAGYFVKTMIRTTWNSVSPPSPTGNSGYYTVDDFKAELVSGNYGVVFSVGHAGNHGIAVEHFANETDMNTRYNALTGPGGSYSQSSADIQPFADPYANEYVIAITQAFIEDQGVKLANNALVFVNACNSFRWFNRNGTNYSNPSIPFLDTSVGAGVFIGQQDVCYPSLDQPNYTNFFGRMLGQTEIPNIGKRNFTVGEAFSATWSSFEEYILGKRYRVSHS